MVNLPQHLIDSREEVDDAIRAWQALRDTRWDNRNSGTALENMLKILRFLGLQCDSRVQEVFPRGRTSQSRGRRRGERREVPSQRQDSSTTRYIIVERISDDNEGIVPRKGFPSQFGSDSKNLYSVMCMWNHRPHTITSNYWVSNSSRRGQQAVIVIYLGGLTNVERNEIRTNCIRDDLSFALLDEILFEYLANIHRDSRFETFIKCALAYSAPNPYLPEERFSQAVPPEMFYGRESLAAGIEYGSTHLLFGGRQIGKTALLRHIEGRGNDCEERRFTWFIDLKGEGFGARPDESDDHSDSESDDRKPAHPDDIWKILLKKFKEHGFIEEDRKDAPSADIPEILESAILQDPRLRILVLFDESDRFMELDQEQGWRVLESMRVRMARTSNRFKFVFAGLHSVQRFALERRENTPLYSFGFDPNTPRRGGLGPFKYDEAQRLVVEPMRTIGIEFESPILVDTILTHTECHPAEIQFFCHRLVALLREKGVSENPPYTIRQNQVDEVANSEHIRRGIRRRYEATFELDERYRAISLSMIYHYHGPAASALESLSISAVRDLVLDLIRNKRIRKQFAEEKLTAVELESLLNELVGLGILVQHGTGYRVRSQRIARVFGRSEDVLDEILKMTEGR